MSVLITATGPTVLRTYVFPDANATILTTNAAVTPAQGGTGLATYTVGDLIYASGTTTLSKLADVAVGQLLASGGVGVAPAWSASPTLTTSLAIGTTPAVVGALRLEANASGSLGKIMTRLAGADTSLLYQTAAGATFLGGGSYDISFNSWWTVVGSTGTISPYAANTVDLATAALAIKSAYIATSVIVPGTNGQLFSALQSLTELTTIAAAATTDTAIQMPAGAVVLAVSVRTTVTIPTATSYSVGDSGSATRFNTANVGVAATSTDAGTKAGAYYNAGALSIRFTMNGGTPANNAGRVRVTIYYYTVTPPTS
jgi:hypothetical protein